ncbi:MAG TPA: biotin--[acetyl-CoA-carboxylase] ligase [Polyangiaceae bacterium]
MHDLKGLRDELATLGSTAGQLETMDETTSTNDVAKRAAKLGAPHLSVFVADSQTAGRGRQGRAWSSARGESILTSIVLRVDCAPARLPPLSLVAGLAVCEAIAPFVDVAPQIKWPNDVWLAKKKVAGILVEASIAGDKVDSLVVGVGINVHTRSFPAEIEAIATSVALHSSRPPERAAILARLVHALDRDIGPAAKHGLGLVHARLAERDALRGSFVKSENSEGIADGIDREGRLRVKTADGVIQTWIAGEVHLGGTLDAT